MLTNSLLCVRVIGMTAVLHHAGQLGNQRKNSLDRDPPNCVVYHLNITSIEDAVQDFRIPAMQSLSSELPYNQMISEQSTKGSVDQPVEGAGPYCLPEEEPRRPLSRPN